MELGLIDFLGQGLIFGLFLFLIVYALMSKKESASITKGVPILLIICFIILFNAYNAGEFFAGFAEQWKESFGG